MHWIGSGWGMKIKHGWTRRLGGMRKRTYIVGSLMIHIRAVGNIE
jgi:hypothetical protein